MMEVLAELVQETGAKEVRFQAPDEWRLDEMVQEAVASWPEAYGVTVAVDDTEHF